MFASVLVALGATLSVSQVGYTTPTTFFCGKYKGTPATVVRTPSGDTPVILWVYSQGNYKPQKRCDEVSARFQTYNENETLNYLTTGPMNGQSVVCVAKFQGGPCKDLLITPKPGDEPDHLLKQLQNLQFFADKNPLDQSGRPNYCRKLNDRDNHISTSINGRLYVNFNNYLRAIDTYRSKNPAADPCFQLDNLRL